jgi:hypothetical protein
MTTPPATDRLKPKPWKLVYTDWAGVRRTLSYTSRANREQALLWRAVRSLGYRSGALVNPKDAGS